MNASEIPEEQLLRWLAPQSPGRWALLTGLGLGNTAEVRTCVREPFVTPGMLPGDVDVVAWDPLAPERGYALEAKRLTISERAFSTGLVSRVGKLNHAAKQVHGLSSIGFHSFALLIFLVADVHTVAPGHWLASAPAGMLREIRERLGALECATLVLEINQTTERHVFDAGSVGRYWIGEPVRARQEPRVTSALRAGSF